MDIVYLVRHGETLWNQLSVIQGRRDVPLSEAGVLQMTDLAQLLGGTVTFTNAVISSDAERCRASAALLCEGNTRAVTWSPCLQEVDFGIWSGQRVEDLRRDEIRRRAWDGMSPDYVWDGGESFRSAHERAASCMRDFRLANPGRDIVVITHGFIIQLLISWWLTGGLEVAKHIAIANGSVSVLSLQEAAHARLCALNITGGSDAIKRTHLFAQE